MKTKRLFLLDAYALIYRSYYAFIKNPRVNSKGVNTSAIFGFVNTLEDLLKREDPTHIAVAFDPAGPTFRHEAFEAYKAQRQETPEDIRNSVPIIKEIIASYNIPILEVSGYEADDVIGTVATQMGREGFEVFMMTPDKDYGQLVSPNVFIYKPKYGSNDCETLGEEEVKAKFGLSYPAQVIDLLGLMGDASDNIPGCPGVGEKTAAKLIDEFGSIENLLANTGQLKGALKTKIEENKEMIIFSRFLATIKTDVPISVNEDDLLRKEANEEQRRKLFEELEFRNLLTRLTPVTPKPINSQPSLFDVFPTDEQETIFHSNLSDLNSTTHKYKIADNEEEILKIISIVKQHNLVCFDTETTSVDAINAELVGISLSCVKNEAYYIPVPPVREEALNIVNILKEIFEESTIAKVGQNMKYDLIVLKNYGVDVKGSLFDTMIAHYLLEPDLRHGMDYLAEIYLNYKTVHIDELIGAKGKMQGSMRDVPVNLISEYACEDADITLQLYHILKPKLEKEQLADLFNTIEMPLVKVLADMEMAGVRLDVEALNELSTEFGNECFEIEKQIYSLAGMEFNINSAKQVGEVLFDRLRIDEKAKKTKTGQYSTNEETLEKLRGKHSIVDAILEYRGIKKLLSTYISSLPELVNPRTNRIHTSFNQTVAATGRLSSSNPNLQNIPIRDTRGKAIRRAFIPAEGESWFSADYSQIELRIMAHLSGDPNLLEAFNKGLDVHAATAAKIYKIPLEEVTSEMRRKAKTANFGIIYGISVFGLSERLNIPRGEAKELIDGYFEAYPQVKEYMDASILKGKENEYVETLFKRRRSLPDINSRNATVRGYAERNAINAPIQGSAADIIKIAMIRIFNRFEQEGVKSKMILQVHDELNFSVHEKEKEQVQRIVIDEMERATTLLVPLTADCGFGTNWLQAH